MNTQVSSAKPQSEGLIVKPIIENPLANNVTPEIKEISMRRDPEEEFFMLAVLAHKMNLTEDYDADFVYDINPR